jgi:L-ascorbate metabolism protein UlaG (beta-lactamase superfamily)
VQPTDIAFAPRTLGEGDRRDVRVRWLGTAGFAIEHGEHTVLIDPYLTRAPLTHCLTMPLRSDLDALRRYAPRADAIVVGHTHFDHALDVPDLALMTGAKVFGSHSAAMLCRARGVPEDRVQIVERDAGGRPVETEVGPFRLRFIPSVHAPLVLGRVPFAGEISDCSDVPMRVGSYRCGAVFGVEVRVGGRTLFHLGSAEIVDSNVDVRNVDLLLMCATGWNTSRDLPERIGKRLAPDAILLSHWDDFLRPLEKPVHTLPAVQMPRLVERLTRASDGAKIGTLPILGELWV